MRTLSAILFWLGFCVLCLVFVLGASNNAIVELLTGLIAAPKREYLLMVSLGCSALIGLSLVIHERSAFIIPLWRQCALLSAIGCAAILFYFMWFPGFSTVDVSYPSQGAEMHASLYLPDSLPDSGTTWPAVSIVSGSAPFRRAFYDTYARRLAQSGYVVLLPDKRGAGESGGTFVSDNNGSRENLTLLAQDVVRFSRASRRLMSVTLVRVLKCTRLSICRILCRIREPPGRRFQ